MSKYPELDAFFDKIERRNKEVPNLLIEAANNRTNYALKKAVKDIGLYQQAVIKETFNDAVTTFYQSYKPHEYERQGNTFSYSGGLYELLDMKLDDAGMVICNAPGYDELYDPSKMHTDRSGGRSLYQTVFVEGFHGGAKYISPDKADVWGAHPSPGTPYYRTVGMVQYKGTSKKVRHRYGKWGKKAVHTISPYQIVSSTLPAAENGIVEKFKELIHHYNDEAIEKFKTEDVPNILSRYK